jgi:hypothetical protein
MEPVERFEAAVDGTGRGTQQIMFALVRSKRLCRIDDDFADAKLLQFFATSTGFNLVGLVSLMG